METIIYVICILFLIIMTFIVVIVMVPKVDATWVYWDIKAILIIALLVEIIILITKIKYYL